jgi:crotonobetainyl-CoA:carnitine CoA-transferase CaiB-like acyl-CoA transferase
MILHDLGAEVIRVEPPGGSEARRAHPLLAGGEESLRSLQFVAYNRGKRSIALDLRAAADRATFLALVATADFMLDSGVPGMLADAGFDFAALRAANPHIVVVVHTPFGLDGPRAHWQESDIVLAALGGSATLQGVPTRAPVRISVPQAWRHAGAEGAVAALVAHARRLQTGEAQFVDVSAQCAITWTLLNAMTASAIQGFDFKRRGPLLQLGGVTLPLVYECKDGHVICITSGAMMRVIVKWLIEDGVVDASWNDEDWATWDARFQAKQPVAHGLDEVAEAYQRWLRRYTKNELLARGLASGISFAPVNDLADALRFEHLHARGYWEDVTLPDGVRVRAPGSIARPSRTPLRTGERAPALNENGREIRAELASSSRSPLATPGVAVGAWPAASPASDRLPFAGLRVADFSWVGVGPITARCLADHGATVIRVESETRPDVLRLNAPFKDALPGLNRAQFYGEFNTSKLGLALDLKKPAARPIVERLLAWADVCIESFTPGTARSVGIDYEKARLANPSLVMVSTCLMGQTGPAASFAGYGYHAAAVAGFYEVTGWPDLRPDGPWVAYTDTIAPRFISATLIAALDHRRRTGEGQWIDAAQIEASLHFLAPELMEHQRTGVVITRLGNRSRHFAPYGMYPCAGEDRWCAIGVDTDAQWRALCGALGRDDWARDPGLATAAGRRARHDELDARIAAWTSQRAPEEAAEALQAAGVPAGMAQLSADLLRDPQLAQRGFYRWLDHPEMGHIPYAGHQLHIHGYASGPRAPAPLLGQHLHEVLAGELGMSEDEIADAIAAGVLA